METDTEQVEVQEDPGARIEEIFQAFEGKGVVGLEQAASFLFHLEGDSGGSHLLRLAADGGVSWEQGYSGEADVVLKLSVDDFLAIADGTFDGRLAVASERVEMTGNLEMAEKLLGWVEPEEAS